MILPVFSDTYQAIDLLKDSKDVLVYLVQHKQLGEKRILKIVHQNISSPAPNQKEAAVLQSLKHPGIPILYDYREEENKLCLVEEYIQGISLQEYLYSHNAVSIEWVMMVIEQVCDILIYLHSRTPDPILYQDLKPEHLILYGSQVRLIDYGIAQFLSSSREIIQRYGTRGYIAPEVKQSKGVNMQSDIYSLGVLTEELLKHCRDHKTARISYAAYWAKQKKVKNRPKSVLQWKDYISQSVSMQKNQINQKEQEKCFLKIAVVGNANGAGVTHVAISLNIFLNKTGHQSIYENHSDKKQVCYLLQHENIYEKKDGLIYHDGFIGRLEESELIQEIKPPLGIYVIDCGSDLTKTMDADYCFYVFSSCLWKPYAIEKEFARRKECCLLCNPANPVLSILMAQELGKKIYGFPEKDDAFYLSSKKRRLFQQILYGGEKGCAIIRK